MMPTRRTFMQQLAIFLVAPGPLSCTPAPTFPVPLTEGVWRSGDLPISKHNYHVWLKVDRTLPVDQLDCDLGPPRPNHHCGTPPLLDIDWHIWNGTKEVQRWIPHPIQASAWGANETSAFPGDFNGVRNGRFMFELNVRKDAGVLKELHPRIEIVKNPGYWCWL